MTKVRNTSERFFDTRAQIIAYATARADRHAWLEGAADEQHIPEPPHGRPTLPPRARVTPWHEVAATHAAPTQPSTVQGRPGRRNDHMFGTVVCWPCGLLEE